MVQDYSAELAERLNWLPTDGADPTGVPAALADVLTPVKRYRHTAPKRAPLNRLEYEFLAALALSGWSMRAALAEAVNHGKGLHRRSGSFKLAWRQLERAGLWECALVRAGQRRLALVRLTERGRAVLAEVGLTAVDSEWEQIEARHRGGGADQLRHTAAICAFLYHARRHGYATQPCPVVLQASKAEPDVRLTRDGSPIYVEVQRRGGEAWRRADKWRSQHRLQGFVALCADTPALAERLAQEAQRTGVPVGCATSLTELADGSAPGLWTLRWRSQHGPLETATNDAEPAPSG
ncbi:MAG: hypothetical protein BWY52_02629 [Chloroflexi bacterium ADurb.Bin325]|nr:MAG: hypothetical protein BWY52_02629 [Chloroflexi bacterium ADurb.Bin325]